MAELVMRLPRMVSLSDTALKKSEWIEHHVVAKRPARPALRGRATSTDDGGWDIKTGCGKFLVAQFAQEIPATMAAAPHRIVLCTRCEKSRTPVEHRGFEILLYVDHGPLETPELEGTAVEGWRRRHLERPGHLVGSSNRHLDEPRANRVVFGSAGTPSFP